MIRTKLFCSAAFCMLGMTGCSNIEDGASDRQATMTLQGTTDGYQTRADYTEDSTDETKMNFSWRSGDKLSVVVDGTANKNCVLTTTTDGKSVPFSGTVTTFSGTKTIYTFYPYSATPYVVTGGDNKETATAALTLPNPQLYTIDGAISNSFMVGAGSATADGINITASASLKQVMSIIKLNITGAPGKVTGAKLKCTDAIFATTATVKLSDAAITTSGSLVNELSMTVTDNSADLTTAKAISFAIFPKAKVNGKKIQIEVTYEDGKSKMIEKDGIDFERNMHYVMAFDGTPVANDYVVVGDLKWAIGNLVANGANSCKIGAPGDGGLYFQFGSLVGWSTTGNPSIVVKPTNYNGDTSWSSSWRGDLTTEDAVAGTGDPCKYYLGNTWRLPTQAEYVTLFENGDYPTTGPWKWDSTSKSMIHTSGLTFPASAFRRDTDGNLNLFVGEIGSFWSASPRDASRGYFLNFTSSSVTPSSSLLRAFGFSVRCVQDK